MATATRPRKRRDKQKMIEGTDDSIPEIDEAAEKYVEARDERQSVLLDEIELKGKLLDAMHKHKLEVYRFNGFTVEIKADERVKVKKVKNKDLGADED